MPSGENGWRSGSDPILRWLRAGMVVALVAVAVIVALDRERDIGSALPVLGIAVGAALILLGYAGVVRLPFIGREDRKDD